MALPLVSELPGHGAPLLEAAGWAEDPALLAALLAEAAAALPALGLALALLFLAAGAASPAASCSWAFSACSPAWAVMI